MRIILIAIPVVLLMALAGCSQGETPRNPAWVDQLIAQYQGEPVGNPPREIWQYQYQGRTVYYVPPQCCDQLGDLYSEDGTRICAPDGGIGGRGDGRCPDFLTTRSGGSLVWQDSRTP